MPDMYMLYSLYSKTNNKTLGYQDVIRTTFSYVERNKMIFTGKMAIP